MNVDATACDRLVQDIQSKAIAYFLTLSDRVSGLTPDRSVDSPVSIAAVGLALGVYPIAVEKRLISRRDAATLTITALQRMAHGLQSDGSNAIGTHGLFYHFLDREMSLRTWHSEVSLVDTAFFLAGALCASVYFDADDSREQLIRSIADELYRSADWSWALNGGSVIMHGWKPECGFLHYGWTGYSEAILLYILALASPTHPVPPKHYQTWTSSYQWERLYGHDHLYAAPLFIHQFSHAWIDFRGIRDGFMRSKDCDYAENTRRAVLIQYEYARRNPHGYVGYGPDCWGLSAGPGPIGGTFSDQTLRHETFGYSARGVPYGLDDGTISPTAMAASLPFAPALVLPSLQRLIDHNPKLLQPFGLSSGFNPSIIDSAGNPWMSQESFGIDQGVVALMIENYLSGMPWSLMRRCPYISEGLRRAGFTGGWLEKHGND